MYQQHPDDDVRHALIRLCDALCLWERETGRENMLILIEHQPEASNGRFEFVADSGKPIPDDSRAGLTLEHMLQNHYLRYTR